MIGYARLLVARNIPNHSTIPDSESVIYLGHTANVPLIRRLSELADGLEPHDHILLVDTADPLPPVLHRVQGRGVPGVAVGGYREGAIPGTQPVSYLRLI